MIPSSIDDILTMTEGHPLIRSVDPARRGTAWRGDEAAAFLNLNRDRTIWRVVGLGPPSAVTDLLTSLRGELPPDAYANVPHGTPLPLEDPVDWVYRVAYEMPPPQPAEDLVEWSADSDAITELLKRTSPDWSVWPGDGHARRWAGVRDGDSGLSACLADMTTSPEIGQVAAIAVRPEARRRALGASITAWAMRRLFAEGCDGVGLGVYAENTAAMRLYDRLGFTRNEFRTSGRLPAR